MKKRNWILATAAVASMALLTAFTYDGEGYPPIVKEKKLYANNDLRGQNAPKLEVGQWLNSKAPETKGKVVLVDFWATWCGPCKKGIPKLNEWAKKFKDDLVIVGVSDENAETVSGFMKGTAMNYPVAVDANKKMSSFVGVQGIPHVLVISADGIVRWQGYPEDEKDILTTEKMEMIIAQSKKDWADKNGG